MFVDNVNSQKTRQLQSMDRQSTNITVTPPPTGLFCAEKPQCTEGIDEKTGKSAGWWCECKAAAKDS